MLKLIAVATLVAGTLDILFAMLLTVAFGRHIPDMLRYVASGPLPHAKQWGTAGAVLGLAVHFMLMAIMAAIFVALVRQRPDLLQRPLLLVLGFGVITYVAMNWLVVPLRFGTPLPPPAVSIATQLFAHVVLVALPFLLIVRALLPQATQH